MENDEIQINEYSVLVLKQKNECEHDWRGNEINCQQIDEVVCVKCGRIERRFIESENPNFPWDKYPLLPYWIRLEGKNNVTPQK